MPLNSLGSGGVTSAGVAGLGAFSPGVFGVADGAFAFSRASVNGGSLSLNYTAALDTGSVPATGQFTVTFDGTANAVTAVAVAGRRVTLTLTTAALSTTSNILVSYTVPTTNPIQAADGTEAAALTNQSVSNVTQPPMFRSAEVNRGTLTVTFNENLDSGSVPAGGDFTVTFGGTANAVTAVAISRR